MASYEELQELIITGQKDEAKQFGDHNTLC